MARLLTSVGIPCGHESVFDWRGYRWAEKRLAGEESLQCSNASMFQQQNGSWVPLAQWVEPSEIVAESSYMATPFLNSEILQGVPVIHMVRHPVRVINSFCNYLGYFQSATPSNSYEQFIYRELPSLKANMTPYNRAATFYVRWNRKIEESKPAAFFRIEDGPKPVLVFLEKDETGYFDDREVNTQKKPASRFALDQLDPWTRSAVVEMGQKYGYSMSSDLLMV